MLSMTGFGTARTPCPMGTLVVRIAAVNGRNLQLSVRSDLRDLGLEELIRHDVRERVGRGTVTVQVTLEGASAASGVDLARLRDAWTQLAALARELGAPPPALEQVANLLPRRDDAPEGLETALRSALATALEAFLSERRREGATLQAEFRRRHAALAALHERLAATAAARLPPWRDALLARLSEVLAQQVPPEVLAREAALHAERVDVREELVRLHAHLGALATLIDGGGDQLGRRLDFLLQEISREVNTTGAKANDLELTRLVLEAKQEVEQMKEQAANVV